MDALYTYMREQSRRGNMGAIIFLARWPQFPLLTYQPRA